MLIVSGTIEINPEKTGSGRAAAIKMMEETRKEKGCIVYEFSQLIEAPHIIRVYEEWETLEDLKAHGQAPHMAAFREALAEVGVVSRDVFMVQNGEKTPL